MAFYCKKYYTKDGKPGADADPDPALNKQKREVIPTKILRQGSAATATRSGHVLSRQSDNDMGDSKAFPAAPEEGIPKSKRGAPKPAHSCTPDFIRSEGLKPRVRIKKLPDPDVDHNSDADWVTPYQEWTPEDEEPTDESDLILPSWWDDNSRIRQPNP